MKLKTILHQIHRTKVHDKDVADALGISPSTFASMKRRNTIPYRAILDFCVLHHINANALLFERPANNLVQSPKTIKYYGEVGAGAGGSGNAIHEQFQELSVRDLLLLFLTRLER